MVRVPLHCGEAANVWAAPQINDEFQAVSRASATDYLDGACQPRCHEQSGGVHQTGAHTLHATLSACQALRWL